MADKQALAEGMEEVRTERAERDLPQRDAKALSEEMRCRMAEKRRVGAG